MKLTLEFTTEVEHSGKESLNEQVLTLTPLKVIIASTLDENTNQTSHYSYLMIEALIEQNLHWKLK